MVNTFILECQKRGFESAQGVIILFVVKSLTKYIYISNILTDGDYLFACQATLFPKQPLTPIPVNTQPFPYFSKHTPDDQQQTIFPPFLPVPSFSEHTSAYQQHIIFHATSKLL